jgi:hypothetical protein
MHKHNRFIKKWIFPALTACAAGCAGQPIAETFPAREMVEKFSGNCVIAQTSDAQGQPVLLWQHVFDDGAHDLAMARTAHGKLLEIRRVTFGGSKQPSCHFPGLAIARGGDWGWHLAWIVPDTPAGKPALRYARMDGAAWVSSPAKRFGDATAHHPVLMVDGKQLKLTWQQILDGKQKNMAAISEDEGRHWH